eukprot:1732750-Heterocapsa_arctica.AAC.2
MLFFNAPEFGDILSRRGVRNPSNGVPPRRPNPGVPNVQAFTTSTSLSRVWAISVDHRARA